MAVCHFRGMYLPSYDKMKSKQQDVMNGIFCKCFK